MTRCLVFVCCLAMGCGGANAEKKADTSADASGETAVAADGPAKEERLGSLPKEAIRGVVRENMRDIQRCYDSELANNNDLSGKVVVTFRISKEGEVDSASVAESTMDSRAVENCIVREVRTWEFPYPENDGHVIVNYPFNFKAP